MFMEIFIDTQSIFYDIRNAFGEAQRLDFIHAPFNMSKFCGLPETFPWAKKNAFVVKKGPTFQGFSDMLRSFGYNVILIDKNAQDIEIGMHIVQNCCVNDGTAILTGNKRLMPLFHHIIGMEKLCYLCTPETFSEGDVQEPPVTKHIHLSKDWLWWGQENQEAGSGNKWM